MDNTEQIESKSRERMQVAAFHAIYKRFRLVERYNLSIRMPCAVLLTEFAAGAFLFGAL